MKTHMLKRIFIGTIVVAFMAPSVRAADASPAVRKEVQAFIDVLAVSGIASIQHTTDGIEESARRSPEEPRPFPAGRYRVIFSGKGGRLAVIFQTEEKVGHLNRVVPGVTDVGGYVELLKDVPPENVAGITHTTKHLEPPVRKPILSQDTRLNDAEMDRLLCMLYEKFSKPMTVAQANNLNRVKDYALAIKFSARKGLKEYHARLKKSAS